MIPTTVEQILGLGSFAAFGSGQVKNHDQSGSEGPLESEPHDNVHGNIGGFMGAFMSPVDPIFFMHHANLDRLWMVWAARQKKAGRSPFPKTNLSAWKNEAFDFFVNTAGKTVPTTAGTVIDDATLDYSYEPGSGNNTLDVPVPTPVAGAGQGRLAATALRPDSVAASTVVLPQALRRPAVHPQGSPPPRRRWRR
jgi:hypothetical protein